MLREKEWGVQNGSITKNKLFFDFLTTLMFIMTLFVSAEVLFEDTFFPVSIFICTSHEKQAATPKILQDTVLNFSTFRRKYSINSAFNEFCETFQNSPQ